MEDYYDSDYGGTAVEEVPQYNGGYNPKAPQLGNFQPWNPQAPQINIPQGEVDWDYVNKAVLAQQRTQAIQMRRAAAQAKQQQDAIRFQGVQEYNDLIKGGATPQEALRRTAGKINYQNPDAILGTSRFLEGKSIPSVPTMEDVDGLKVINFGHRYQLAPGQTVNPKKPTNPVKTDAEKSREFTSKAEYTSAMRDYNKANAGVKGEDGKLKVDPESLRVATRRLRLAEQNLNAKGESVEPIESAKELTKEIATELLKQAKGDKLLARKLAKEAGYKF